MRQCCNKISHVALTLSLLALAGCTTSSKITLQPEQVPSLYSKPAMVDEIAEVAASLEEGVAAVDTEKSAEALTANADIADKPPAERDNSAALAIGTDSNAIENPLGGDATLAANGDSCQKIDEEIAAIDLGLGDKATETPLQTKQTATQKVGSYFKNVVVETVMGPLQPIIQTVRSVTNAEEKEKIAEEAKSRGNIRRAYLLGYREASGCLPLATSDVASSSVCSDGCK